MATEQRLQALEDEHKVIKGEVKQTLENIRDFLLDLNLPAMQEDPMVGELHEHEEFHEDSPSAPPPPAQASEPFPQMPPQAAAPPPPMSVPPVGEQQAPSVSQVTTIGPMPPQPQSFESFPPPQQQPSAPPPPAPVEAIPPQPQPSAEEWPEEETEVEEPELSMEDEPPFEEMEEWPEPEETATEVEEPMTEVEEPELPLDEAVPLEEEEDWTPPRRSPRPERKREERATPNTSQVNLLTNLIRWVAVARSEIGSEQLPAFLDVYCIGEPLSPEIREVIFYLMERIAPKVVGTQTTAVPTVEARSDADGSPEADTGEAPVVVDEVPLAFPGGDADVWNRLILELHGILGRGQASFRPEQLPWKNRAENELPGEIPAGGDMTAGDNSPDRLTEAAVTLPTDEVSPPVDEADPPEAEEKPLEVARKNLMEAIESQEESEEIQVVKKKKPKAKKKKPVAKPSPELDKRAARLKLVLPIDESGEEEISIGEFFLDMSPKGK